MWDPLLWLWVRTSKGNACDVEPASFGPMAIVFKNVGVSDQRFEQKLDEPGQHLVLLMSCEIAT